MRVQIGADGWVEYDDVGEGRPIVLLHAFPLDRTMWRPQVEALRDGFRLVAPDLRGFGGTSPFEGPASIERMADDVAALLDALRLDRPAALCGLSMGGYVALAFARQHPARLSALVLADTRAEPDDAAGKANRDKLIAFAQTHPAGDVLEQLLPKMVSAETMGGEPEIVAEVRRIAAAQKPAALVAALQALRDRPDARSGLGAVAAPTLVLVGSDDALTPPAAADVLASGIAGARLEKIAGAGHLSNLERPGPFTAALRSFLETLPPG